MRWSLGPAWWLEGRTGVITTLLCLAPVTLQLIFAYGLRRGRRVAYVGTLILQASSVFRRWRQPPSELLAWNGPDDPLRPEVTTAASLLLMPVLLNVALCAITWWMRRSFTIHAAPSTTSTLARRWLILMAVCAAAVLVLGLLTSDSFHSLLLVGFG